jgi:protein-disulfide isomerase
MATINPRFALRRVPSSTNWNRISKDGCNLSSAIFRLTEVHPYAEVAAESAEFAGTAAVFWEMHDALFRNHAILSISTIMLIAEKLRLPETMMCHALETGQLRTKVRNDFMGGVRSDVNGTPTFFINGVRHEGAFDLASLMSEIQSCLTPDSHGPSH